MHIVLSTMLGFTSWIALIAAVPNVWTFAAGPFVVSGVALAASLLRL